MFDIIPLFSNNVLPHRRYLLIVQANEDWKKLAYLWANKIVYIYIYILFVKEIYPFLHFSRIKFIYIVLKNACINIFRAKKYCSYLFCVFVNYFPHYMWMNVMAFVFCLWRFHRLDILLLTMNRFYRRQQRRVYRSKLISNHRR